MKVTTSVSHWAAREFSTSYDFEKVTSTLFAMISFSEGQRLCPLVQGIRQLANVYGGGHSALGVLLCVILTLTSPPLFYSLDSLHTCLWLLKFWGFPLPCFPGQSKTEEASLHLLASQNLPTVPKPCTEPKHLL